VERKKVARRHAVEVRHGVDRQGPHPDTVSIGCMSSLGAVVSWIVLQAEISNYSIS
jgi:hypothetical protein